MSYIGNAPISAAFLVDTFSGTGAQVAFTMTVAPANTSSIIVAVTGVVQDPSTYSVSGTTLTFSAAPPSGTSNISVRYLGIPASGVTTTAYRTVTNTTATASQTSFTIPSYTVGYVDVYRNGVYLPTTDYTATTGTTVVLNTGATSGDTITTISFFVSSVLNAIPNTAGSVSSSNIVSGVTLTTPNLGTPSALVLTNATGLPQAGLGTNVAGNGPIFSAYSSAGQTVSNNTITKILFDTENFDSNSNFASSRFTPTVAGYYVFTNSLSIANYSNTGTNEFGQYFFKNGSHASGDCVSTGQNSMFSISQGAGHNIFFNNTFGPVYANGSTDYFEIYLEQNTGGSRTVNATITAFSGFMVRSA